MDWMTMLAITAGPLCYMVFRYLVIGPIIWLIKGIVPKVLLVEREGSLKVGIILFLAILGVIFWVSSWPTTTLHL